MFHIEFSVQMTMISLSAIVDYEVLLQSRDNSVAVVKPGFV